MLGKHDDPTYPDFFYRHTSGEAADVTTGVARGDGCVPYNCIHPNR